MSTHKAKKYVLQCEGKAAEALEAFRERKLEIEKEGRAKPDMIAYKELKHKFGSTKILVHGELQSLPQIWLIIKYSQNSLSPAPN